MFLLSWGIHLNSCCSLCLTSSVRDDTHHDRDFTARAVFKYAIIMCISYFICCKFSAITSYIFFLAITEDQETKLNKLLKLWESKSNYFDSSVIEKMKSPTISYQEYQANLISLYANLITPLTQATKATFEK